MRILHVYRTFFPDTQGGLEEAIRQLCAGTSALGAQCTVFTTTKKRSGATIELDEATVVQVPETFEIASCNVALSAFSQFSSLASSADIVHYQFPWPFADVLDLVTRHDKPTVITYQSDIVRQKLLLKLYKPLMRRFLASADRIVCTSPNYLASSSVLRDFAKKVDVIPIGLDEKTYPEVGEIELQRAQEQFGKDFFLFVGVLRYYKGLHILLDAIANAPYQVVIVGSGAMEQQLKQQAKDLNLDNVVFAGRVSDELKVALLQLSRAIVFPSHLRSEAFGVTLLEGAMYSRPLISAEVGSGTSYVNIHNETGIVVAPGSSKMLRWAMDELWNQPEKARKMGLAAKKRFDKLFNGDLMAQRYWQLYHELLDR